MSDTVSSTPNVPQVNSVLHATRILELFAAQRREYISLTEISQALQMHKTTVYRILRTLHSAGWIEQSAANGQYRLGSRILLVSSAVAVHRTGRELIAEEMRRLSEQFNEMVVLTAVIGDTGVCLDIVKSRHNLSIITAIGYIVPLNAGATGKMLLAAQPDETVQRVLQRLPPQQAQTLLEQVGTIREQGFCCTENEVDEGAAAVAVPLTVSDDVYVLSISGPLERLRQLDYSVLREALLASVESIRQKSAALSAHTLN